MDTAPVPPGPGRVIHVDAEYSTDARGSLLKPLVVATLDHLTGEVNVLRGDALTSCPIPPFPLENTIVVSHNCAAEWDVFRLLRWPIPRFYDTFIEHRLSDAFADWREDGAMRKRLGRRIEDKSKQDRILSLYGMARSYGVKPLYADHEKANLQAIAAKGDLSGEAQWDELVNYCVSDVLTTRLCLPYQVSDSRDWAAASLRADFLLLCSDITARGLPVRSKALQDLTDHRAAVRERVIHEWDEYGLYVDGSFSRRSFADLLCRMGWPWPRLEGSNQLDLRRETFQEMARFSPVFAGVHRMREMCSLLRRLDPPIDPDGRVRVDLRPFSTKTARCAPGSSVCLTSMPKYMRKFISPPPGYAIIQGDCVQQEVLIAAVISEDQALYKAYQDGDVYAGIAKLLGLMPLDGTKETHRAERNSAKPLMLGILFRMTAEGLAARQKMSLYEANKLHTQLHQVFSRYFDWSAGIVAVSRTGEALVTPLGWKLRPRFFADSSRTRTNFMIQSTGSDLLRTACLLAAEKGLDIIMTVHDSIIIHAPAHKAEEAKRALEEAIIEASILVLGPAGSIMRVDTDILLPGQTFTLDERDETRFRDIQRWLHEAKQIVPSRVYSI
jgi:hypothetical protein